jgi:tetratricopeptide (TPR) repeat protein
MSKHKKSKNLSKTKKQKQQKNNNKNDDASQPQQQQKKVPSIMELIQAGDAAVAALEPDQAMTFYAAAEHRLQKTMPLATKDLIYVLEKLGELKASEFHNPMAAKQDFQQAIALLLLSTTSTSTRTRTQENDNHNNAASSSSSSSPPTTTMPHTSTSSDQETLAGLHLYIGQLSCEQEALEAYQKGLECLERSLQLRQHEDDETDNNQNNDESSTTGSTTGNNTMEVDTPATTTTTSSNNTNNTNTKKASSSLQDLRRKVTSARVAIAELYLTDLCYQDDAEQECETYVNLALSMKEHDDGESMMDALQTAASLKLSQQRTKEACTFILRAYQKIHVGCEALSALVVGGLVASTSDNDKNGEKKKASATKNNKTRSVELLEVDAAEGLPSFDFRLQTAKILLECSACSSSSSSSSNPSDLLPAVVDKKDADIKNDGIVPKGFSVNTDSPQAKCNMAAIHVLGSLLAENDEVPDVWYLLGCAYQGHGNNELATFYWSQALELLSNIQKDLEAQQEDRDDIMQVEGDNDDDDDDDNEEQEEELAMQIQAISCKMEDIKSKLEDLEGCSQKEDAPIKMEA